MRNAEPAPSPISAGLRNLDRALRSVDESQGFDRCMVGSFACGQSPIEGHVLPRTTLELISDSSGMLMGSDPSPPKSPMQWVNSPPLRERSIRRFSIGKWSCAEHDALFSPIDRKSIDFSDPHNLLLLVYRATLRYIQFALSSGGRLALSVLDDSRPLQGLPKPIVENLQQTAVSMTFPAVRLFALVLQMHKFLQDRAYDRFEFHMITLQSQPTLAAAGMRLLDGPGDGFLWADGQAAGDNSVIPAWLLALPQASGQTLITASPLGMSAHTKAFHAGIPSWPSSVEQRGENWRRLVSRKILGSAADLAILPERYNRLSDSERQALASYLLKRSLYEGKRVKLPNLLKEHWR